jgi:AbrB family looped-hinge helix DNA binding protein
MQLVTVKSKYQVVIPAAVRRQIRVGVGDLLEAKAEDGRIVLTPKSVIDRRLAEALEDVKAGRVHGPFESAESLIASLTANTRASAARKPGKRTRR